METSRGRQKKRRMYHKISAENAHSNSLKWKGFAAEASHHPLPHTFRTTKTPSEQPPNRILKTPAIIGEGAEGLSSRPSERGVVGEPPAAEALMGGL